MAALGQSMLGVLQYLSTNDAAAQSFRRAAAALPYSADPRNLQNVVRVARWNSGPHAAAAEDVQALMVALLDALATEPDNSQAVENLASFHRSVSASPKAVEAIGQYELDRQQTILRTMKRP